MEFYLRVVPGSLVYYHPNAYGKAALAFMDEEAVNNLLPARLPALTPRTIVLRTELLSQLAEVRRTGIAYDNEEYTSGIMCIGSPVFGVENQVVAGLGITVILSTFNETLRPTFEQMVLQCAWRVSRTSATRGTSSKAASRTPEGLAAASSRRIRRLEGRFPPERRASRLPVKKSIDILNITS